ncbi:M18 family aminopeptidase [Porticoccaceae bacterium]|nr:M18 family aminopeptidase [Porticoccaceae bacterium]MDB9706738.1 M18 family aminopeptidase [Porticoccaceae bacterium]MDB9948906.1 M18 family aminopeptidase [Porticoccaceae bacterium]MDB9993003.1 M18 family aminopeptidase [Porticoccaceae bacterium]
MDRVENQAENFNQQLAGFIDGSPTPFHAVANMVSLFREAGFQPLSESDDWALKQGEKYFVTRNGSSIIAFVAGSEDLAESGIRMAGAHTDSPCLMVKPQPEMLNNKYFQLGVEVYGGALLNPWFDRDLSLAGRLVYSDIDGQLKQKLINFDEAIAVIPSLAIHLDRTANKDRTINPQTDIPPILMQADEKADFRELLAERFLGDSEQVMDYELCFYDVQGAATVGINKEFFAAARLDNLLSCFVAANALINADTTCTSILVCNDHEEVGSVSSVGADGPFLESIVDRLCSDLCADGRASNKARVLDGSLLISCDNAHAVHPNFADNHEAGHKPALNGGPVIKVNSNQRYATNGVTASLFRQLCAEVDVPVQSFVTRTDLGCGSTIGPVTAAKLGIPTLDVGIPQLAMHSCRELTGTLDPERLSRVLTQFFKRSGRLQVTVGD